MGFAQVFVKIVGGLPDGRDVIAEQALERTFLVKVLSNNRWLSIFNLKKIDVLSRIDLSLKHI